MAENEHYSDFSWLQKVLCLLMVFAACYSRALGLPVQKTEAAFVCELSFPQSNPHINTIYIPFHLVGRLMIVQARVDTVSGNFIVDTGSERLLLNRDYMAGNPADRMITAVGNTGLLHAREHQVDSLHLDQLRISNLLAHVVDLDHIETKKNTKIIGILGYNVFKDFELFIDFPNSRIVLSRVNKHGNRLDPVPSWEVPYDSLTFELKKHFIVVRTIVNKMDLEMILDSGAELNLIDRRVNKRVIEKFTVIKRVNLIGMGKRQVEVIAGVLHDVHCGNQSSSRMNTLLTSLDEINNAFHISVDGVLGYEFLNQRRTMINYQKRKLYFFGPSRS